MKLSRKIMVILLALLALCCFSQTASAECKTASRKADKLFHYRHPGANPYQGTLEEALVLLRYPKNVAKLLEEQVQLGNFSRFVIKNGETFLMTFGRRSVEKSIADFGDMLIDGEMYVVEVNGIQYRLLMPYVCGNWTRYPEIPAPTLPKILPKQEEPAPEETPEESVVTTPEIIPEEEVKLTEDEKATFWDGIRIESFASTGIGEKGHNHNSWRFGSINILPISFPTDSGRNYLGAGYSYSAWKSRSEDGYSDRGHKELVKPLIFESFNYDEQHDYSLFGLLGRQIDRGHTADGRFRSRKGFDLYGLGASYNNYARENDGEDWFPETQAWASVMIPFNKTSRNTWEGKTIPSENNVSQVVDVGARQFIYNFRYVRTYAQAEFLGDLPEFRVLNLELGVSDREKIIFAGSGCQFNLDGLGRKFIADVGIDVSQAGNVLLRKYRENKVRAEVKEKHGEIQQESETGAILVKQKKSE